MTDKQRLTLGRFQQYLDAAAADEATISLSRKHAQTLAMYSAVVLAADPRALRELPAPWAEALIALSQAIAQPKVGNPLAHVLARMARHTEPKEGSRS